MTKETFAEIALMAAKPIPSSSTRKRKRMLFDDPFFEDVKFTCYDDNPDAITAVGDQGQTSTCYAFQSAEVSSTTHCLNGKSWVPVPLSTQELIDNVHDQMHLERTYVDAFGCSPASLTATFEYMKQFGLYESKVYPYVGMRVANPVIPDEALKTRHKLFVREFKTELLLDVVLKFIKLQPVVGCMREYPSFRKYCCRDVWVKY
ncbi:uncharacterized protein LOC113761785 isoform X3 [Coffea eugenioides]|uniref:uncharacterized protein LOC113761785 isoform X3 n=1 Tax=Coffea eugenioides TaxID=49369 RepID=UPI000F612052|nr:uncharacterized protein LOC113761785 isoform X3 [Coffea eugenioides]